MTTGVARIPLRILRALIGASSWAADGGTRRVHYSQPPAAGRHGKWLTLNLTG